MDSEHTAMSDDVFDLMLKGGDARDAGFKFRYVVVDRWKRSEDSPEVEEPRPHILCCDEQAEQALQRLGQVISIKHAVQLGLGPMSLAWVEGKWVLGLRYKFLATSDAAHQIVELEQLLAKLMRAGFMQGPVESARRVYRTAI